MTELAQKRIVCAACKNGEHVVLGARHYDRLMNTAIDILEDSVLTEDWKGQDAVQGFIDQFGKFHDRKEALAIATAAGQVGVYRDKCWPEDELFSEDLY